MCCIFRGALNCVPPSLTAAGVVGSGGGAAGIGALYFTATHAAVSVSSAA